MTAAEKSAPSATDAAEGSPRLSVVVCTRDRAAMLDRALTRLPWGELRDIGAEVVIVDNGSSDATPEVIASHQGRHPAVVRSAFAPIAGLSRARNTGIAAARAPIIAFTDDDCVVDDDWPAAVLLAFDDPTVDWCAGPILPLTPDDAAYGVLERATPVDYPSGSFVRAGAIQGANLSFRRTVFDRYGSFDEGLGAGTPFRCEDVEMCARATMRGARGSFAPSIVVRHGHGRDASDIELHRRADDRARGAYYAKMLLDGHPRYVLWWVRTTWAHRDTYSPLHEIRGAGAYVSDRLARRRR